MIIKNHTPAALAIALMVLSGAFPATTFAMNSSGFSDLIEPQTWSYKTSDRRTSSNVEDRRPGGKDHNRERDGGSGGSTRR
jgi:hypothetical protein